jgi:hypothetical protein
MKKARKQSHHEHASYPAFPHANGLTAYSALSPVIGLCCHRRRNAQALSPDASVEASGPRGFAVCALAVRLSTAHIHRILEPNVS